MRIAPVGWAFETEEETLMAAKKSAECTHNHPEGIKGAQAVALSIFLARNGIAGGIAEALYGIPKEIRDKGMAYLPKELRNTVCDFEARFGCK